MAYIYRRILCKIISFQLTNFFTIVHWYENKGCTNKVKCTTSYLVSFWDGRIIPSVTHTPLLIPHTLTLFSSPRIWCSLASFSSRWSALPPRPSTPEREHRRNSWCTFFHFKNTTERKNCKHLNTSIHTCAGRHILVIQAMDLLEGLQPVPVLRGPGHRGAAVLRPFENKPRNTQRATVRPVERTIVVSKAIHHLVIFIQCYLQWSMLLTSG